MSMSKGNKKQVIPYRELNWDDEDLKPSNFKVLPEAPSLDGTYKFYEIIYEIDNVRHNIGINLPTVKASRLSPTKYGAYGITLIFDPDYFNHEDPEIQEMKRKRKAEEFKKFEEKYYKIHVQIALEYLQKIKPRKFKNKTVEEAVDDDELVQEALDEIPFNFTKEENDSKYEKNHGLIFLPLNSQGGNPEEKNRSRRTNFRGINEPESDEVHFDCIKKMMSSSSEITPMIRYHRIGDKKKIQIRFIHAIVSAYFVGSGKKHQVSVFDKLSNDEDTKKRYEESKKKVDNIIKNEKNIEQLLIDSPPSNLIENKPFINPTTQQNNDSEIKKQRFSFAKK